MIIFLKNGKSIKVDDSPSNPKTGMAMEERLRKNRSINIAKQKGEGVLVFAREIDYVSLDKPEIFFDGRIRKGFKP